MRYILKEFVSDNYLFIEESRYPEGIFSEYISGEAISMPFEFILYNNDPERITGDVVAGINPFIIVSSRMKAVIESISATGIRFYPAKLLHSFSNEMEIVWILQVIKICDAFDWERSDYKAMLWDDDKDDFVVPGKEDIIKNDELKKRISLKTIFKLHLLEDKIGDTHVFRLQNRPTQVVFDDVATQKINSAGLCGFSLTPIDEYCEL